MQYWKKLNSGKVERLEGELNKHPEKLNKLKEEGYVRIMAEDDDTPYKNTVKTSAKKAVKKITNKIKKK